MIPIIFYPGTHGHYLEFVLNKAIHGDKICRVNPLGISGTSHTQNFDFNYRRYRIFKANHPWQVDIPTQPYLAIDFDSTDDIFVVQLLLKRGGDNNLDPDTLEHRTYEKWSKKPLLHGKDLCKIDNMINGINKFTDLTPYYNIKDESWPAIASVDDFYNLPIHILDECINVFGYKPIEISETRPDAPRWVLRSIFKSWFYNQSDRPSSQLIVPNQHTTVYNLPLRNLYHIDSFKQEIINIGKFFDIKLNIDNFSPHIHQQFIDMVPYLESKFNCERIINSIDTCDQFQIKLNVVEEGYVNYCLEQKLGITMPEETEHYFKDTSELSAFVKQSS